MMKLYQTTIFIAVMFALIYLDMNNQGYAGPVVAAIIAYLATVIPLKLYDWSMRLQRIIEDKVRERRLNASRHNHIDSPWHQ